MFCKKCGYKLKDGETFCKRCRQAVQSGTANFNIPPILPNQQTPPPKKKKKTGRIVALVTALVLLAGAGSGIFVFRDEILGLFSKTKTFDENNVGEIYCAAVDLEHIGKTENGCMYADNEVLLVATEGTSYKEIEKLAKKYDAEIVGWIEQTGDYQLKFSESYTMEEIDGIAQELEAEKDVDSASVNYIAEMSDTADTEERDGFYYGKKWQSDLQKPNDSKGKSWGIESIETFAAWDLLKQNSDKVNPIKVGLIDNGFDTSHEDLGFAEVFYEDGNNGAYSSDKKHGTHVAGIMGASTKDNTGICGVYPYGDGNLYAVSYGGVVDSSENGNYWSSVMVQKISYSELILRNVKVINQSEGFNWYEFNSFKNFWGNTNYKEVKKFFDDESNFSSLNPAVNELGDFFERMLKRGYDFVIVSAAGNDSDSSIDHLNSKYASWNNMIDKSDFPDVYARIIVVGALNYKMNVASYSNGGERVDVYAPGGDGNKLIYSTVPNSKYGNMYGTSMAAPHVSGVAAMVWSANNSLTGAEVKDIVCSYSNGRCTSCKMVDAYVAVQKALGIKTTEESTEPQNGGVLCYVVNKEDENTKIENAKITMVNVDTSEEYTTTTDSSGHFELFLPEGKYTLTVKADGYEDYTWPGGNADFQNPIEVKNNGVNYLDDWIKLTPKSTLPALVQAVLDNESTWKTDIAACDTVLSSMTSEGNPQSSLDTDDTFWFQDLDMDGTPEFIVESKTGDVGYGDFFEKAWNVYYLKDSSLAKYQGADSIGDVQSTVNLFYNDESEVVYQLYKDNTTGKFVNLREGYGWSVVYGRLSLLHLGDNSWEQDLLTAMDEDIPEKGCELSEDASSPTEASSKNLSYAEAVEWYNSYKSNLTAYSYTTKKINLFDWDSMSSEEKQQALEDSYNAWNYGEGSTEDFPLSAVMKQVESQASAAEQTQSQSTYKDAYKQKIQELSANTASLNTIDYCLCDMNADGIPELIVITGTCEADYVITFYTYKNDAVTVIGDGFSGWHSSFHYDSDTKQFCTQWGQMGVGGIRWYAFDGNTVTETNSVDNIEYGTLEVHFDNYDDAYAPYGTFSDVETAYCHYSNSDGWTTSYYTPTADGSYDTEEYFGIDYSLIDNYVVTNVPAK